MNIVISIKPKYIYFIQFGIKKIEVRKKVLKDINIGNIMFIYCSKPIKAIVGETIIEDIICLPKYAFWHKHKEEIGICKNDFEKYVGENEQVYGLRLCQLHFYQKGISLDFLREELGWRPPQNMGYASMELVNIIKRNV